jgi:hypothetical protein
LLEALERRVGDECVRRIDEGAIADGDTLDRPYLEAVALGAHDETSLQEYLASSASSLDDTEAVGQVNAPGNGITSFWGLKKELSQ